MSEKKNTNLKNKTEFLNAKLGSNLINVPKSKNFINLLDREDELGIQIPKTVSFQSKLGSISYQVHISTASHKLAGTDRPVYIQLSGDKGSTDFILLDDSSPNISESGMRFASFDFVDPEQQNYGFPACSIREFGFEYKDIGCITEISIKHDPRGYEQSAWRPENIVTIKSLSQRAWLFNNRRWLSLDGGNQVYLKPEGTIYSGGIACRQAVQNLMNNKNKSLQERTASTIKGFAEIKDHIASSSVSQKAVHTKSVRFHFHRFSDPGLIVYLLGNTEPLGKWNPENALRMFKSVCSDGIWRGNWKVQLEMDADTTEIKYTYITFVENKLLNIRKVVIIDTIHTVSCNEPINTSYVNDTIECNENGIISLRNECRMITMETSRTFENILVKKNREQTKQDQALTSSTVNEGNTNSAKLSGEKKNARHMEDISRKHEDHLVPSESFIQGQSSHEFKSKYDIKTSRNLPDIQLAKKNIKQTSGIHSSTTADSKLNVSFEPQYISENNIDVPETPETEFISRGIATVDLKLQKILRFYANQCSGLRDDLLDVKKELNTFNKGFKEKRRRLEEDLHGKETHEAYIFQKMEKERERIKHLWQKEQEERKMILKKLQELQGNIRVFCRIRPSHGENEKDAGNVASLELLEEIYMHRECIEIGGKEFRFDHFFPSSATQEEVYSKTRELVRSVLDGYKVCIMAYGQTGSGKTYTMTGTKESRGLNYRVLQDLFNNTKEENNLEDVSISISVIEIYNDSLRDLLDSQESQKKLEIRRDTSSGSEQTITVQNLTWIDVENAEKAWRIMENSVKNRSTESTDLNSESSRSHLIVKIRCVNIHENGSISTAGELNLVDLAGSERTNRSKVSGERMKEAQHINKSLFTLGDVFSSLISGSTHIPYRNSKLTYLLQDCLGGKSKTLLFVNISSRQEDYTETLSSLEFSQRASKITLGRARKNIVRYHENSEERNLDSKTSAIKSMQPKHSKLQKELKKQEDISKARERKISFLENELRKLKEKLLESGRRERDVRKLFNEQTFELKKAERSKKNHDL